ncbi:hypothetical protein [Oharaeibacter diazotrophicus]|uniref:Uncharacterized protein n=1 Tax=Oharaeibacter diazotrophicus TaxID=1920512 RepID=A0A4R6RLN9_9HYPH|nr:hypothetical protein [Oharaeibacter diazotrophicus]TDP87460.1 hypothetical protein EDD54_1355 [Oharaeibacter diazotrophicus]BBE70596.1 hypothetical protein OHA_1_00160 [Pleomorphomonas sp. SM30]GLS77342.1 hypothetical protein GCM10007904_26790 [Oharaeibacter diazotrophicus]
MSISALGSSTSTPVRAPQPLAEKAEGAGPDRDGDADDVGAAAAAAPKAALPKGVGSLVDVTV